MMDPISALAVKTGTSWLAGQFKTHVIEKWSRRRAGAFFQTFTERLAAAEEAGRPLSDLEPLLAELLNDTIKSEILFDAYRKVCLSASASLGPRIIAVIIARLIREGRVASDGEERLLIVAETFGDKDLTDFADYLTQHPLIDNEAKLFDESEEWLAEQKPFSISSINLSEYVGNWCLKLVNCGLVVQDIVKGVEYYSFDSDGRVIERGRDSYGTVTTYTWKLVFRPEVLDLKNIIEGLRSPQSPATA
jgi:hypothetical protein